MHFVILLCQSSANIVDRYSILLIIRDKHIGHYFGVQSRISLILEDLYKYILMFLGRWFT